MRNLKKVNLPANGLAMSKQHFAPPATAGQVGRLVQRWIREQSTLLVTFVRGVADFEFICSTNNFENIIVSYHDEMAICIRYFATERSNPLRLNDLIEARFKVLIP